MMIVLLGAVVALLFIFGASIGSFIGVLIERAPRARSIMAPSTCQCGRRLRWYENLPVLGWLRVRGQARCCGTRIPAWYLYLEVAGGGLAVLLAALIALFTITLTAVIL